jgi:hypothetical protein
MPTKAFLTLTLATALSGLATPLVGQPQSSPNFSREPGLDRPGNDLGSVAVGLGDVNACMAVCAANVRCNAYTLYTPTGSSQSYCWYKHTAGPTRPAAESISGVRQTAQPAPQVQASSTSRTLSDGRTVTLPTSAWNCGPGRVDEFQRATMVTFICLSFGAANVQIAASDPQTLTPLALLQANASEWQEGFMSWPAEQQATFLRRETRTLANGTSATFHCLAYDKTAEQSGVSYCILDLPHVELLIAAEANTALEASNAVNTVLNATTMR